MAPEYIVLSILYIHCKPFSQNCKFTKVHELSGEKQVSVIKHFVLYMIILLRTNPNLIKKINQWISETIQITRVIFLRGAQAKNLHQWSLQSESPDPQI